MKINKGMALMRAIVPRALRAHSFACALVIGLLLGVGLRIVPTSAAAVTPNAGGAASTACTS